MTVTGPGGTRVVLIVIKKNPEFPRGNHRSGKKYAPTHCALHTGNSPRLYQYLLLVSLNFILL